jgi:hypothetical protein
MLLHSFLQALRFPVDFEGFVVTNSIHTPRNEPGFERFTQVFGRCHSVPPHSFSESATLVGQSRISIGLHTVKKISDEVYRNEIQPRLAGVTIPTIMSALNVCASYAANIRRGKRRPHARHWEKLARLIAAQQNPACVDEATCPE